MNEAISIMIVGMFTVFMILFLILIIGNVLIRLTNRYVPETIVESKKNNPSLDDTHAAISAAIELVSKGKGTAVKIEHIQ
ncbi:MAG TPA: hypothetical protein VJ871_07440 [Bacteroidales bacterium]|nr:hypothetical protein [Bacteroidales bacterium]